MWSQVIFKDAGIIAKKRYEYACNEYHNWQHILDCYDYLEQAGVEYSEDLDLAVLYHDVVYDELINKEQRSADLLLELYPGKLKAAEIIMATVNHSIEGKSIDAVSMIKADLHALTDINNAVSNYSCIMRENCRLYNISEVDFAKANESFMTSLFHTMSYNYVYNGDPFWLEVSKGIRLARRISYSIMALYQ